MHDRAGCGCAGVNVSTTTGESYTLQGGEQLLVELNQPTIKWTPPVKIKEAEVT